MGYSCTQAAEETLTAICVFYQTDGNPNILTIGTPCLDYPRTYFFERGREQADGSITGSLMRMLPGDLCERAGAVKISASGEIVNFPAINRKKLASFLADVRSGKIQVSIRGSIL